MNETKLKTFGIIIIGLILSGSNAIYNTYIKNTNEFIYCDGAEKLTKMAPERAYTSEESDYNLCQVSSMNTLVYYKCFYGVETNAYYNAVICFSKYKEIPDTVQWLI